MLDLHRKFGELIVHRFLLRSKLFKFISKELTATLNFIKQEYLFIYLFNIKAHYKKYA